MLLTACINVSCVSVSVCLCVCMFPLSHTQLQGESLQSITYIEIQFKEFPSHQWEAGEGVLYTSKYPQRHQSCRQRGRSRFGSPLHQTITPPMPPCLWMWYGGGVWTKQGPVLQGRTSSVPSPALPLPCCVTSGRSLLFSGAYSLLCKVCSMSPFRFVAGLGEKSL